MIRFAILKDVGNEKNKVVLEYSQDQLLEKMQALVREQLVNSEKWLKHRWNKKEIEDAIHNAFNRIVLEFKQKSVYIEE